MAAASAASTAWAATATAELAVPEISRIEAVICSVAAAATPARSEVAAAWAVRVSPREDSCVLASARDAATRRAVSSTRFLLGDVVPGHAVPDQRAGVIGDGVDVTVQHHATEAEVALVGKVARVAKDPLDAGRILMKPVDGAEQQLAQTDAEGRAELGLERLRRPDGAPVDVDECEVQVADEDVRLEAVERRPQRGERGRQRRPPEREEWPAKRNERMK